MTRKVKVTEIMKCFLFVCSSTQHKIVKLPPFMPVNAQTEMQMQTDRCGLQQCKVFFPVRIKCKMLSLTVIRWRIEPINLNNLAQLTTCNRPNCAMSVEGDKSKNGVVFLLLFFSFMTAYLGRLYHHFFLHGAGPRSVFIHLRTQEKCPDYLKSRRSSPSRVVAAQQSERYSVRLSVGRKGKRTGGRQVEGWEEAQRQYVESKISVFFLPGENYLQPCTTWLTLGRLCFADTIDTK